jgi:hypothetical protein
MRIEAHSRARDRLVLDRLVATLARLVGAQLVESYTTIDRVDRDQKAGYELLGRREAKFSQFPLRRD